MRSERARAHIRHHIIHIADSEAVCYLDAYEAVTIVEEEAEAALQALRDKFAEDIHKLAECWDISEKKSDRLWLKEREELKQDIEYYKRDLAEAKERLKIAEKVIADKNKIQRK